MTHPAHIVESLAVSDLSEQEGHALNLIVALISKNLEKSFGLKPRLEKGNKIVTISENYDKLGYPATEVTRNTRYTRHVNEKEILRTQMTSVVPSLLESFAQNPSDEVLWTCPGLVFRRDVVDRTHVGEPHQMDIWYVTRKEKMNRTHLLKLVEVVVSSLSEALKQKIEYRCNETSHFYTEGGIEVEILYQGRWLEIGECGLAGTKLLKQSGLDPEVYSGLALGMGLDRAAMIIKTIEDIRILRDEDARIQKQMRTLDKFKSVSKFPATKRDLSIAVDSDVILEELTEKIMAVAKDKKSMLEEIALVSETSFTELHPNARVNLGMSEAQKNMLLRITFRHVSRTLTSQECNDLYEDLYRAIHEGSNGYSTIKKAAQA